MRDRKRWLPKAWARHIPYHGDLSRYSGDRGRRLVLHTEGVDRATGDPTFIARYVNGKRIPYHAAWDPRTGRWVQMVPFDRAARALENGGIASGVGCNRTGIVVIQVCVVGYAGAGWSRRRMRGAWVLDEIMRSWGIPWESHVNWNSPNRALASWLRSGVVGHCHAPNNSHTDGTGTNWRRVRRIARRQNRIRRAKNRILRRKDPA